MARLAASTEVSFDLSSGSGKRLHIEADGDTSLPRQPNESYARVFPTQAGPKVTAVMGSVAKTATGVAVDIDDYVTFSGSASAGLRYAPTSAPVISDERFLGDPPNVVYNEDRYSIELDREAFGIVKVSYQAQFDRYRVTHGDGPCAQARTQTQGGVEQSAAEELKHDPAFLVAEAEGWESASTKLEGPPCPGQDHSVVYSADDGYKQQGLVVEEDPKYPTGMYPRYFRATRHSDGFALATATAGGQTGIAACRVRVYPDVPMTVIPVNCAVSPTPTYRGTRTVNKTCLFNASWASSLPYPPDVTIGPAISVSGENTLLTVFGDTRLASYRLPGDTINEVTWINSTTFGLVGARTVRSDEIAVTTAAGNNTIPCYGYCSVEYQSTYRRYDVVFSWDAAIGWYAPAALVFIESGGQRRRGTIELTPPSRGGVS